MPTLTPTQTATMARGVYRLLTDSVANVYERGQSLGCEGMFKVADNSRFQGQSGALAWKVLSGFGYIAEGEGKHQGEILLVTRGTTIGVDWLSNLNMGMQIGPGGYLVHAGFHEVWKSYSDDVRTFLRGRNPSCIHCVGHSLGGALATLNADYLSSQKVGKVELYTFGAPRAGGFPFSVSLTKRLGRENIHRVSHAADPVPMIPLFPFQHLPYDTEGLGITSANSGLISINAHLMEPSYIPGVTGRSWADLAAAKPGPSSDAQIKGWLDHWAAGGNGLMMGSANLLWMISKALIWVLKRARDLVGAAVGTTLVVGATVLDQLAWMLKQAADISLDVAGFLKSLVIAIYRYLGRTLEAGAKINTAFLRWVLSLLFNALRSTVVRALSLVS